MNDKSMQHQVLKLKREIIQLRAQNKNQINYSMDLFDDTSNNSLKGIKRSMNTNQHKSQKQFSLSTNCYPKTTTKTGRSSFSSIQNYTKKEAKVNYFNHHITNSSRSTQLIKVPIPKGMFSYKKSFIDEEKKAKFNLNSSLMSQDRKMNLFNDDEDVNAFNNNDGNNNQLRYHQSSTSIDLSKYKIISSQASGSGIGLSHKNSLAPIDQKTRNSNAIESYQHMNSPLSQLLIDNKQILSPNQGRSNYANSPLMNNSMQLSPVIINNINLQSNPNEMKPNTIMAPGTTTTTTESFGYFKQKRKNERESRRMIIELIKMKSKQNKEPIDSLLLAMNISHKVLEQEKKPINPPQSNMSCFPSQSQQSNYQRTPLMLSQNQTRSSMSSIKQMHQFMSDMNDDNKEKINMINFLSVPRVMSLSINQSHVPYIFVLTPNSLCHLYGIETYVFKWREFKDGSNYGYFDLLKVTNCFRIKAAPNQFKIQTEDIGDNGNSIKAYEIEASSSEMSKNYVDCLNFLSQLIKCKAYKRIGTFSPINN